MLGQLSIAKFLEVVGHYEWCTPVCSNYCWPTGNFTKMWQLAGHFQQNYVGYKTTASQDLKLKRDNTWVKGTLSVRYLCSGVTRPKFVWGQIFWHCLSKHKMTRCFRNLWGALSPWLCLYACGWGYSDTIIHLTPLIPLTANIFNDYFVTIGKNIANSITPPCSNKYPVAYNGPNHSCIAWNFSWRGWSCHQQTVRVQEC